MNMGTNGVHAVLVVFSVSCGFSEEEEAVIGRLLSLFGGRIYDYMIIVFTGGDELASHCRTFDDFLYDCPETLKVEYLVTYLFMILYFLSCHFHSWFRS